MVRPPCILQDKGGMYLLNTSRREINFVRSLVFRLSRPVFPRFKMAKFVMSTAVLIGILCFVAVCVTAQRFGQSGDQGYPRRDGRGDTNIPCYRPGYFVGAPDGCNRCYCELDRKLSSTCSRAFCPPGFPSGSGRRQYSQPNTIFDRS
ncbi:unnamed protein product [Allacma fusca]|uniref:Uncharacterized protein n=1 Tax=Allacma fusca TaxID=39272 RepID=A0A8J2JL16_9HEXA|nr:unnamed protein product [Allacma fusca]